MVYVGLSSQLSIHNSVSSQSMQCDLHTKIILLGLCLDYNVLVMEVRQVTGVFATFVSLNLLCDC